MDKQPIKGNFFDQMMLGPSNQPKRANSQQEKKSFDLAGTAQIAMETYQQLSPYVRELSHVVKKFKK